MSGLQHAQSFRDLIVYQKSRQFQKEIFKLTKSFPKDEMFCGEPSRTLREDAASYFIKPNNEETDN